MFRSVAGPQRCPAWVNVRPVIAVRPGGPRAEPSTWRCGYVGTSDSLAIDPRRQGYGTCRLFPKGNHDRQAWIALHWFRLSRIVYVTLKQENMHPNSDGSVRGAREQDNAHCGVDAQRGPPSSQLPEPLQADGLDQCVTAVTQTLNGVNGHYRSNTQSSCVCRAVP